MLYRLLSVTLMLFAVSPLSFSQERSKSALAIASSVRTKLPLL